MLSSKAGTAQRSLTALYGARASVSVLPGSRQDSPIIQHRNSRASTSSSRPYSTPNRSTQLTDGALQHFIDAVVGGLRPMRSKPSTTRTPHTSRPNISSSTSGNPAAPSTIFDTPVRAPILKTNPYANHYEADAEEFDDEFLPEQPDTDTPGADLDQGTVNPTTNPRRFRLSDFESIHINPGYIIYERFDPGAAKARRGDQYGKYVITNARLRDACVCKHCKHISTRQKNFTTGDLAEISDPTPDPIFAKGPGRGLTVTWPKCPKRGTSSPSGRKHHSWYSVAILRRLAGVDPPPQIGYLENSKKRILWTRHELIGQSPNLRTQFDDLLQETSKSDSPVLLGVLEQLHMFGIAIIEGVPTDNTSNADCSLRKVANWIGEIRNTFYGETWDVKSVKDSKNVAYTSLDLGPHMDLLWIAFRRYFSSPPRFQILHCLRNRVEGGESYFVDSFASARRLAMRWPEDAETLKNLHIPYTYNNDGHNLRHTHPVLPTDMTFRQLDTAINWSPPFQDTLTPLFPSEPDRTPQQLEDDAAKETNILRCLKMFHDRLSHPDGVYTFKMQEGDLVLFDNRRVVHARTAFRDKTEEEIARDGTELVDGEPTRWLKGCYLDGEVVWDKMFTLELERRRLVRAAGKASTGTGSSDSVDT